MPRTITVGLDGSSESRAAAEWAAREAPLRGLPVRLLHVWEPVPEPLAEAHIVGDETHRHWAERVPRETAEGLRARHPDVEVIEVQLSGSARDRLVEEARDAELLVLGSRALSGLGGYLVGSVGQAVVARTEVPVILVRAGEKATDEHVMDPTGIPSADTAFRPVVLGLDISRPADAVVAFAFEEALRRRTALHVVSGRRLPGSYPVYPYTPMPEIVPETEIARQQAAELTGMLGPWRLKYPDVEIVEVSRTGSPARHLIDTAHEASLVVVGRRVRRNPFGAHIGAVTHAVLHHATAPVAVVAHS
ncbi:universal stress protein [Streptomyces sp. ZYX-F-203]